MNSDCSGFPRGDVARYVSAGKQGKRHGCNWGSVSAYSGILYQQPFWIEDFAGQDVDTYKVSLANRILCRRWSEKININSPMTPKFQIDHLGIAVKSLSSAKAIYEKLGLSISPEETVEHEQVKLVMVPVGESRLELLEATSPDSTIAKFVAKRGEGLHHVCLKVPDLAAAIARLKADGVRLVSEEIKVGAGGHRYIFVHPASTGGVLLELVQG